MVRFLKYTKYTHCGSFMKMGLLLDITLGYSWVSKTINENMENTCIIDSISNKIVLLNLIRFRGIKQSS